MTKLRWLERDGAKVLQYLEPYYYFGSSMPLENSWIDVPAVTDKKEWCEHIDLVDNCKLEAHYTQGGVRIHEPRFNFCPICGKPRPK